MLFEIVFKSLFCQVFSFSNPLQISINRENESKEMNVKVNETFKADKGFVPPDKSRCKETSFLLLGHSPVRVSQRIKIRRGVVVIVAISTALCRDSSDRKERKNQFKSLTRKS